MPRLTEADRALLANAADIMQIDITVGSDWKLSGKGQVTRKLFEGFELPVVPKIMNGALYSNYREPLAAMYINLTGALNAALLVERSPKDGQDMNVILSLLDGKKLEKTTLPRTWSRKKFFERIAPAVLENFRLHTFESDVWQKMDEAAVTTYLEQREEGRSSTEAMTTAGMV